LRPATLALAAFALSTLTGCSYHYRWSPPTAMGSRSLGQDEHRKAATDVTLQGARIEGTQLRVTAVRRCEWVNRESIETTYVYHEQEVSGPPSGQDRAAGASLVGAVAGGATLLGGLVLLPVGLSSAGDDGSNPQPVLVGGAVALGAGALALGLSFLPARKLPDKRIATIEVRETPAAKACDAEPVTGVPIVGVAGARAFLLGTSDAEGSVTAELTKVIDPRALLDAGVRIGLKLRLTEELGGAPLDVDQGSLDRALEGPVWAVVAKEACASERSHEACGDVVRFLALYPDGSHATEARRLVGAVVETIEGGT
jgi:hypothetical protein